MIRTTIVAAFLAVGAAAQAAEIKVISANGMREVIAETKGRFEASSGHQLNVTVVETGAIRKRVLGGEAFDVIMVPRDVSEAFAKANRVAAGSAMPLIRVNFGLAVRADAPRPDTSTPDALRKTRLVPNRGSGHHAERVVKGEADLAVQAEHEIKCVKGAAFLDYPKDLQRSIVFMGSVGADTTDAAAAKAYLTFVTGPEVAPVIKAKCLSPG